MRFVLLATLVACSSGPAQPARPVEPLPSPTSARPADPAPPPLRLPGDVAPVHYTLEQTIVPTAATLDGVIHIDAKVIKPTRVVWLNATDIVIAHAELAGRAARVIAVKEDFVGLTTDGELPAGPLTIDITYKAPIDHQRSRGVYAEKEDSGETYAYTFFEAIDARRAFPCFDEPSYKVPWTLVFHVPKDQVALANAPVVKETDEPNGMKRVEVAESKPLPSYLVAFVVGPFELVDGGTAGRVHTPIRFITPKGRTGELGYAKEVTPKVLVALETYFDMDYPYGKLDVAIVPRFWGTMEHPGIVAMGQPLTLIRPDEASRNRRERYANILAHELSHYWFGDLVTMAWWDDTWLNEALGSWSDVNITEAAEPTWRWRDNRFRSSASAMEADEKLSSDAIRRKVENRSDIEAAFDGEITYAKGATVFAMLEAYVGRDKWRTFINAYLKKHAWKNASADDFLADMRDMLGAPISESAHSFLEQPGVPLVEATASCGPTNTIVLHQTRSLPAGVTDRSAKLWKIPVCMRVGDARGSSRVCKLLDKAEDRVETKTCPTWIVPNDDGLGYYRSRIDAALVKRELTKGSGASAVEKAIVIVDLAGAMSRGEISIDKQLELAPLILADADDKVAQLGVAATSFPDNGVDDATEQALRAYRLSVLSPLAHKLGWTRSKNDSDDRNRLRGKLLGQVARWDDALGTQAEALADKWVESHAGIDNDLVDTALTVAARRGDAARFERYLAAAKSAKDRPMIGRFLGRLGMFTDPALVKRALAIVLDGTFDQRESLAILYGAIITRENRDIAFAWFKDNLDKLLAKMRSDDAAGLLAGITSQYCDPARRKAVEDLLRPRLHQIDGADNYVNRALESDDQCITKVARELPTLKKFLARYGKK